MTTKPYIIGIVGLPGSGKTYLANTIAAAMPGTIVLDDIYDESELPNSLKSNIIVTDPLFCDPEVRANAKIAFLELYSVEINWIFFEKSAEQCQRNIEFRNDGRDTAAIFRDMAAIYEVPDGVNTLMVWRSQDAE